MAVIIEKINEMITSLETTFSAIWNHTIPDYMKLRQANVEYTNFKVKKFIDDNNLPKTHFDNEFNYDFSHMIANEKMVYGIRSPRIKREFTKRSKSVNLEAADAKAIFSKSLIGRAASGLHFCDFFPESERCTGVHATLVEGRIPKFDKKSEAIEKEKVFYKRQDTVTVSDELVEECDKLETKTLLSLLQSTDSYICPMEKQCDFHLSTCTMLPEISENLKAQVNNLQKFKARSNMITSVVYSLLKEQASNLNTIETGKDDVMSYILKGRTLSGITNLLMEYTQELDDEIDLLHELLDAATAYIFDTKQQD